MQCGDRPRNCREAFTREGDQVFYNRYYSSEQNRAQYLSRDVEEEIRFENITLIFKMFGLISIHEKTNHDSIITKFLLWSKAWGLVATLPCFTETDEMEKQLTTWDDAEELYHWNHFQNDYFQLMHDKKYWQLTKIQPTLKSSII